MSLASAAAFKAARWRLSCDAGSGSARPAAQYSPRHSPTASMHPYMASQPYSAASETPYFRTRAGLRSDPMLAQTGDLPFRKPLPLHSSLPSEGPDYDAPSAALMLLWQE